MRLAAIAVVALVTVGCAGGTRTAKSCDPVPAEYARYEGLFRSCEVDQPVRRLRSPPPEVSRVEPLVNSSAGCYVAVFTVVVDEKGGIVPGSAKLVRTNSESFATVVSENMPYVRFEPAKKSGMPVRQLYEYDQKMQFRRSAGTMSSERRPPPC